MLRKFVTFIDLIGPKLFADSSLIIVILFCYIYVDMVILTH